ncbi:hypothetical protein IG631_03272 [Alternaria alternata]|nr:hypothetical protein IG631_03272 [Alternaria alternata]
MRLPSPRLRRPSLTPGKRCYSIYLSLNKFPALYIFSLQFPTCLYQTLPLHVDRHYSYHPPNPDTLHNRNHGQGKHRRAHMYPAGTPLTRA